MRAVNDSHKLQQRLLELVKITGKINSAWKLDDVLNYSMFLAEDFLRAGASSIWLIDKDKDELYFRLVRGESADKISTIRMKMGEGIVGHVAASGKSVVINDPTSDPRWKPVADNRSGFETKQLISVPLKARDEIIGVIQVLNKENEEPFNNEDLFLLQILADQVALALENARLYEEQLQKERMQQEVEHLKILDAKKTELLNHVVHELQSPLANIIGYANLIKLVIKDDEAGELRAGEIILEQAKRLNRLVEEMLDLARIRSGRIEIQKHSFSITELLKQIVDSFLSEAKKAKVKLRIEEANQDINLCSDRDKLSQVLSNLVSNSIKYAGKGSIVTLGFSCRSSKENDDVDMVKIMVRDNGVGIPLADLDHIFEEFYRVKGKGSHPPSGTGLGLAITKSLVKALGGEISVKSRLGEGSEFTVTIPTNLGKQGE